MQVLLRLPRRLCLDILSQIYNRIQIIQGVLVDAAHWVVDEVGAEQEGEKEDARVMVEVFVHSSEAFSIDDYDVHVFVR